MQLTHGCSFFFIIDVCFHRVFYRHQLYPMSVKQFKRMQSIELYRIISQYSMKFELRIVTSKKMIYSMSIDLFPNITQQPQVFAASCCKREGVYNYAVSSLCHEKPHQLRRKLKLYYKEGKGNISSQGEIQRTHKCRIKIVCGQNTIHKQLSKQQQ